MLLLNRVTSWLTFLARLQRTRFGTTRPSRSVIVGDIVIEANATLTISPGVEVLTSEPTYLNAFDTVHANSIVRGTDRLKIGEIEFSFSSSGWV